MVSRVIPVDPFDLVVFGGTGDLAKRKILPGLFIRFRAGQMPPESRIIGAARADLTDEGYRAIAAAALAEFVAKDKQDAAVIEKFLGQLHYVRIDATGEGGWAQLAGLMRTGVVRAFYFSVAPTLFGDLAERLHCHNIADDRSRIVVEKPLGPHHRTICLGSVHAFHTNSRGAANAPCPPAVSGGVGGFRAAGFRPLGGGHHLHVREPQLLHRAVPDPVRDRLLVYGADEPAAGAV